MLAKSACIAVDWGTTNRRVYLLDRTGTVLDTFRDDLGVLAMVTGDYAAEIASMRSRYDGLPVLAAGMVGSSRGWREISYIDAPASLAALAAWLVSIDDQVSIVPGVALRSPIRTDVMRGEEVQVLGAIAAGLAVLAAAEVEQVGKAGGSLIVSPNVDVAVISATVSRGLVSIRGYFTISEAFAAFHAGAAALKLFPADGAPPVMLKAQRAVLPKTCRVLAVGGITPQTLEPWSAAGADGFGLGSNLYRPGKSPSDVARDAEAFTSSLRALSS